MSETERAELPLRSLFHRPQRHCVEIIDQTLLPHQLVWSELRSLEDFCRAISTMQVRGAPLIGVTAAYGLALEISRDASDASIASAAAQLLATRPTAVNLAWALQRLRKAVEPIAADARGAAALAEADAIAAEDVEVCRAIGRHGLDLLRTLVEAGAGSDKPLQVMTHCNAGWLATLEWGTALAPIYAASAAGIDVHVWVSETRPRNQGASLTSWELNRAGIPHTVIADNAAGYLLQQGQVDCVLVGSDRTVANGDVCNKIGTYLKALAANAAQVPFYVALPSSTIDWDCADGSEIPIELRSKDEVLQMTGMDASGQPASVRLAADSVAACNPAFDVTPSRLVTALVTELGTFEASPKGLGQIRQRLA